MSLGNFGRLGKLQGIFFDIIAVFCVFLAVDNFIFARGADYIAYIAGTAIIVMLMYILDSYNYLCSYKLQRKRQALTLAVGLIISAVIYFVLACIFYKTDSMPLREIPVIFAVCYPVMLLYRYVLLSLFLSARKSQTLLILCGDNNCPPQFAEKLRHDAVDCGIIKICGTEGLTFEDIEAEIREAHSILIMGDIQRELANKVMLLAKWLEKPLYMVPDIEQLCLIGSEIANIGDTLVLGLRSDKRRLVSKTVKRAFDFCAAALGLVILSPLFALIVCAIKLDTKGPAFYKQERYTINKARFDIIKFRTMVENAEKDGAQLATEHDGRITRVGKFLRRFRLDELPQLLNILKGEMSFVGPRPERPIYADEYSRTVKNYDLRHMFKAGLTGFAQVYGRYNTKVSDKILFDWIYINKFSIWLDIKLLIQTAMVVFIKEYSDGVKEEEAKPVESSEAVV